uniref:Histone deacetylase domain-containing protein n=1 Tax=Arcella intermedia TaxID=1963864 RepID=A0A6B2LJD5_9EUKA
MQRTRAEGAEGRDFYAQLGLVTTKKVPLVYSPRYNIKFFGLEKFHPFDSCKYEKIYSSLVQNGVVNKDETIEPSRILTRKELEEVHNSSYLDTLSSSSTLASITEIGFVSFIPNFILQHVLLKPFLYATSGSVLSGHLAVEKGWAVNLGGGFHHSSYNSGGGFCTYADITLCHKYLRKHHPKGLTPLLVFLNT